MTLRKLLTALLLCLCLPLQAATEVIPLNYRTADEVLGVVQSMLGSEGKVSAYGNQLIVNAPPAKIGEVRVLLQQLDTRPRRLLITVESADSSQQNDRGYGVDGSLSAGNAEVQIGRGEVNGRDQVRIIRRSTDSRGGGTQQVQATEGYPALIQVGQSVPLTSTRTGPYGQVYQDTQYRDVTRGFYVTASLSGELVHLTISSQRDRLSNSRPGAIDVQSTDTRVSGRLGEWMTLGGVSEQSSSGESDVLRRYSTQGREDMSLRIKVEALD
ncbi:secretin [Pseudomonas sp. GOM7]|uniref:secretin N-terminal domain-containing protein n=1 Tax=unclassified Pseudomonas TaxID=196821 RepID=UPI00227CE9D2|nr:MULTISPECIES: secretin N-terminal domain-containing protein [unclassified Pseudomonas]WAJ39885.1 secretin [Pseudomonas sp. GOM7]